MEIILKNLQKKFPIPQSKIIKAVKTALRHPERSEGSKGVLKSRDRHDFLLKKVVPVTTFLSIVFVGPQRMRTINKKYLKHDYVTDVLTFDLGENQAEIIICPRVASTNARRHQTSTENEIILYVIHGILHLAGYDDHSKKDKVRMVHMESVILSEAKNLKAS